MSSIMKEPKHLDVLMGKGRQNYGQHFGNKRYHQILLRRFCEYDAAPKIRECGEEGKTKPSINREIISIIKTNGGRFLKKNPTTGLWEEANDKLVVSKIVRDFSTLRKQQKSSPSPQVVTMNTQPEATETVSNTGGVEAVELPEEEDPPPLTSALLTKLENELRTALESAGIGGGSPTSTLELFEAGFDFSRKISEATAAAAAAAAAASDPNYTSSDCSFKVTSSVAEDPMSIEASLNGSFARVSLGSPSTISTCGTPAESVSDLNDAPHDALSPSGAKDLISVQSSVTPMTWAASPSKLAVNVPSASGTTVRSTTLRTHRRQNCMFVGGNELYHFERHSLHPYGMTVPF